MSTFGREVEFPARLRTILTPEEGGGPLGLDTRGARWRATRCRALPRRDLGDSYAPLRSRPGNAAAYAEWAFWRLASEKNGSSGRLPKIMFASFSPTAGPCL